MKENVTWEDANKVVTYNMRIRSGKKHWKYTFHVNIALVQYSVQKSIKVFGQRAIDAGVAEMGQLHRKGVFKPVRYMSLTKEQKSRILRTLMFIKEKRDGRIKARACVDGRKQIMFIVDDDPSSPTVALEALLLTCIADALEGRDVAVADVEGAFLEVDIDEEVIIELDEVLAKILISVDPMYAEFIHRSHGGKEKLYLILNKAMYGCIQSAKIFFGDISKKLENLGFESNDYDPCVFNKDINGSQLCILMI